MEMFLSKTCSFVAINLFAVLLSACSGAGSQSAVTTDSSDESTSSLVVPTTEANLSFNPEQEAVEVSSPRPDGDQSVADISNFAVVNVVTGSDPVVEIVGADGNPTQIPSDQLHAGMTEDGAILLAWSDVVERQMFLPRYAVYRRELTESQFALQDETMSNESTDSQYVMENWYEYIVVRNSGGPSPINYSVSDLEDPVLLAVRVVSHSGTLKTEMQHVDTDDFGSVEASISEVSATELFDPAAATPNPAISVGITSAASEPEVEASVEAETVPDDVLAESSNNEPPLDEGASNEPVTAVGQDNDEPIEQTSQYVEPGMTTEAVAVAHEQSEVESVFVDSDAADTVSTAGASSEELELVDGLGDVSPTSEASDESNSELPRDSESDSFEGNSAWDNTLKPPMLENPQCFIGADSLPVVTKRAENDAACEGKMYAIVSEPDEDVFVDLQGETLTIPLVTMGGRNVIVMNGTIDLEVQPGCDVGDLEYWPKSPSLGKNIMPRPPSSRMLGFGNYQTSWVEGMLFLANGHQTDVIVANSGNGFAQTAEDSLLRREHVVVNSRAEGWEGTKEYLHGDFIQSQKRIEKALRIENVTALSAHQWITFGSNEVWVRNYYADVDPVYGYDNPESDIGPGLVNYMTGVNTNAPIEHYENIHFRQPNGGVYGTGNFGPNPNRFDPRAPEGHDPNAVPDMELHWYAGNAADYQGNPPPIAEADFAPRSRVGSGYESPFTYEYCL